MSGRPLKAIDVFGPPKVDPLVEDGLTDASHAQRFAEAYGLELKHHHRRGIWIYYDGLRWRPDTDGRVYRLALDFVRSRQASALDIPDRKCEADIDVDERAATKGDELSCPGYGATLEVTFVEPVGLDVAPEVDDLDDADEGEDDEGRTTGRTTGRTRRRTRRWWGR